MKTVNRTPETHPLTWRLRDDKQPCGWMNIRAKTAMPVRVAR
jgi:NADH-quinone oxidoreductase subunit F